MLVVVGASAQVLAEQDAAVAIPLQFPSVPINEEHVDVVPVYEEHDPKLLVHPYPVVTHPAKKAIHPGFVDVAAGASEQVKARQAVEPADIFAVHGPSDPMRPVHP